MFVVIKQDGRLALKSNGGSPERELSNTELLRELRLALERNPQQAVVVAADKRVPYEKVMDTLNGLRQAGIRKVGLQTQTGQVKK